MIQTERRGDIWIVTLDRSEKANALTRAMLAELADNAEAARSAKAVIFTGAGKVFSAGADLDEMKEDLATDPVWERLSRAVADLPCLTIAALNGSLAGGAFGMALACDLRVAVPTAKFFYPVMKLGYLPQPSDPQRLAALVGPSRAKLILMAGARIEAKEALEIGLIDRIASEPLALAEALVSDVLAATPEHATKIKEMIDRRR